MGAGFIRKPPRRSSVTITHVRKHVKSTVKRGDSLVPRPHPRGGSGDILASSPGPSQILSRSRFLHGCESKIWEGPGDEVSDSRLAIVTFVMYQKVRLLLDDIAEIATEGNERCFGGL